MKKNNIGQKLAAIRKAAGLSQKDIADRTGMVQQKVSAAESGNTDNRISTIERIADALGYRVDLVEKITSLSQLAEAINESDDYPIDIVDEAILANGWTLMSGDWDVCHDGHDKISFNDEGKVEVVSL